MMTAAALLLQHYCCCNVYAGGINVYGMVVYAMTMSVAAIRTFNWLFILSTRLTVTSECSRIMQIKCSIRISDYPLLSNVNFRQRAGAVNQHVVYINTIIFTVP